MSAGDSIDVNRERRTDSHTPTHTHRRDKTRRVGEVWECVRAMVRGHCAAVKSIYNSINVCIFNTYVRIYLHVYMGGESARARVRELVCVSMGLCACGCMHVREWGWLGSVGVCVRGRKRGKRERKRMRAREKVKKKAAALQTPPEFRR